MKGKMSLIFLLFFPFCLCSRSFYSAEMCQRQDVNHCSFQIPYTDVNGCLIYGTDVCNTYNFLSWNLEPISRPVLEPDEQFIISLVPYSFYKYQVQHDHPVSAINITFTIFNKDIKGFSVLLTEDSIPRNVCRIFDFRNSSNSYQVPLTMFYDCFHLLVEDNIQNVTMTFRMYPVNFELIYYVFIPPVKEQTSKSSGQETYLKSACDWKPLIMIFQGSLQSNLIHARFSKAPKSLNIPFYTINLHLSDEVVQSLDISDSTEKDMLYVEFVSAKNGYYSISVMISVESSSFCTVAKTNPFFVGNAKDFLIICVFLLIVTAVFIFVLLFFFCKWFLKPVVPTSNPTLLLVYSFDCIQHEEFLLSFIEYLNNLEINCNLTVNTIYGRSGDPFSWLEEKYCESDIIVFVISEGFFHTFNQNNSPRLIEGHHWKNQLMEAQAYIFSERSNCIKSHDSNSKEKMKKICKICFPYSGKQHVPKFLKYRSMGPLFMLPKNINDFLCFVFDCSSKFLCFTKYQQNYNFKSFNDDEELCEKLKIMQRTVSEKKHIRFESNIKRDAYVQNEFETKFDILSQGKNSSTSFHYLKPFIDFSTEGEKCMSGNNETSGQNCDSLNLKHSDYFRNLFQKELNTS